MSALPPPVNPGNPFSSNVTYLMACQQLRAVARAIDLDAGVAERLMTPKRSQVVSVPVRAGKLEQRFAIATGAGLPLISRSLCAQLGCRITGKHTARRASGEAYEIPPPDLPALRLGPLRWKGLTVGVLDFAQLVIAPSVEGTLSLADFHGRAFTIARLKRPLC